DQALALLEADGADGGALQDVRRSFHAFTGSGSTYGLPAVSAIGLEGERRCSAVGAGPAVASDVRAWREASAALRREVALASAVPASVSRPDVVSDAPATRAAASARESSAFPGPPAAAAAA